MTIIFNNHEFKYEIEAVCKLFFPCILFKHEYQLSDLDRDNLIVTQLKQEQQTIYLSTMVRLDGQVFSEQQCVDSNHIHCEKECERLLAVTVYLALKRATGIDVKWGIMTGIRPVKQLNYWIEQGHSIQQVKEIFQRDYLASEEKFELCKQVREHQISIIDASKPNSYSLYVSIPFCPTRCSYCSFVSSSIAGTKAKALVNDYVEKLCEEIRYIGDIVKRFSLSLETIYIGGGTPTTLSAEQLILLTNTIKQAFLVQDVKEYTIEAGRADTITREKLLAIRQAGATRISINPQTFQDHVLKAIGRKHTVQQVIDCYHLARELGFEDINMDLIAGLPEDTLETFQDTIDKIIALSPTNVTVHTLTIKRSSDLFQNHEENEKISDDAIVQMVEYAYQKLTQNGYYPYYLYRQKNTLQNLENIGYCKKGYEGRYNIYIMEEIHTILAAGASAVSKLIRHRSQKVHRIFNYKYPFEYNKDFKTILERKNQIAEFYQDINFSLDIHK